MAEPRIALHPGVQRGRQTDQQVRQRVPRGLLVRVKPGLKWTEDFNPGTVKLIGAAEVVGAVGVVAGGLVPALHWGAIAAAVGLALVMIGAIVVHARRKETSMIITNAVLLALAVLAAIGWATA